MKKLKLFTWLLVFLMVVSTGLAFASESTKKDINFRYGSSFIDSAAIIDITRSISLPIHGILIGPTNHIVFTSGTTVPGLEYNDMMAKLVWADGEGATVKQTTFMVPRDYSSGGVLKLVCSRSSSGTPPSVDFEAFVNRPGSTQPSVSTNQSAIALSGLAIASPQQVTLAVVSDFATLQAADIVTFNYWRSTSSSTENLEVLNEIFEYTATQ